MEKVKKETTDELIKRMDESMKEITGLLDANGIQYDLKQWVTIAEYAKRFGISDTSIVSNWIRRGKVPPENVIEIPVLNGMKLIKAIEY